MSIVRIEPDNIERYELRANPKIYFASSSSGITGSLPLFSDGSATFKDVNPSPGLYSQATSASNDADITSVLSKAKLDLQDTNGYQGALGYIDAVHSLTSSTKFAKSQKVTRFTPSARLAPDFLRKKSVRQTLFPYYRSLYSTAQWNYTNYHTLNFVTGGNLPTNTVIMYPAGTGTVDLENQNALAPDKGFTFDFYINPRYTVEKAGDQFKAGTIFHMSSCYAISLVTGSDRGPDNKPSGFRLLLQLSQSADIPPSKCAISNNSVTAPGHPGDPGFLFVSNDNSLKLNSWHHIGIRWGGPSWNAGTGSFVVDGQNQGNFVVTSQSCMQTYSENLGDPDALFIGNFYEGRNTGSSTIARFFNSSSATEQGFSPFGGLTDISDPENYIFNHPLNAELHDLKIFNVYRSDRQLLTSSLSGYKFDVTSVSLSGSQELIFYVPPFFTKESLSRNVLQTPFQFASGTVTDDPFNVAMSFGVGGHELNLQNFTREFVRGLYPRLLGLESTTLDTTTPDPQTANYFLYEKGANRKRNITVLPCDNGRFSPNFQMLATGSSDKFVNDFGISDFSIIKLTDMVSTASIPKFDKPEDTDTKYSILEPLLTPISVDGNVEPGVGAGQILTILQRTRDTSSNEVVFFDVSNMFYGDRIKPESVVLTDLSVTGSNGRLSITLKDDGHGNLYRADAKTQHAKWASVGNVLYEEGILVVKSPNIPMFGSNSWEISFEGERNIHVYEVNVPAPKALINSSTNPTFQAMLPSDYPSETASSFVYITGIQLHDENLNVIGRVNLAQPIIKRDGDRITFRLRMDY